jgi:DNA-binding CsgD family transcriptional regulator
MLQDALVRLIYEAVDDPLVWNAFLTAFAEAVHAETAGILTQDKAGQWAKTLATVGMDLASRRSYEEYFVCRNPWLPRRKMISGTVETGDQVLSKRELMKTEFYRDFLEPHIWLHSCSTVTNVEESTFSSIYALRSPGSGAFTSDEVGLCQYLAPHLQTATRIYQRIVDLEATLNRIWAGEMDNKTLARLSLTPAETRLAIALFKGQSVEAYAKEAAISINTARWHVKQIYAKTGVKRQSELIHMLLKCKSRI